MYLSAVKTNEKPKEKVLPMELLGHPTSGNGAKLRRTEALIPFNDQDQLLGGYRRESFWRPLNIGQLCQLTKWPK